jgi:formylglycine-generating enzyme
MRLFITIGGNLEMKRIWKWMGVIVCLALAAVLSCGPASKGCKKTPSSAGSNSATPLPETLKGNDGEDMALIPAGYFMMGAPEGQGYEEVHPRHRVWVDAFYMDKYEVTFDQYDKFCGATGRKKPSDAGWGRGNRPVIKINWDDANAYCQWAGKRLPTEAEWEKAARGGTDTIFFWGGSDTPAVEYAWFRDNSGMRTHPVGEKMPNPFGLYDMMGNVSEWLEDWYGLDYYAKSPERNPQGPVSGLYRALRGGSWGHIVMFLQTDSRSYYEPSVGTSNSGCRCARNP